MIVQKTHDLLIVAGLLTSGWPIAVLANEHGLGPGLIWREAFSRPGSNTAKASSVDRLRIKLGARLFRDPRLSGTKTRSCAGCHHPNRAFTDGLRRAIAHEAAGAEPVKLRNTPTLFGLSGSNVFNWDGSATTLAEQVLGPLMRKAELGGDVAQIITRLSNDQDMVAAFAEAFPNKPRPTQETVTSALATYVASLNAPKTKFDVWISGDDTALNAAQKAGFRLFVGKAGCVACHAGWRFTDRGFHDIGLPGLGDKSDKTAAGKIGVRAFKTPTLRAVNNTGPYMHDGRFDTLEDVIDHYASGVQNRQGLSALLQPEIKLTVEERAQLVAFLKTL